MDGGKLCTGQAVQNFLQLCKLADIVLERFICTARDDNGAAACELAEPEGFNFTWLSMLIL